jgi:amino acid adenylation domain-containing protein
VSYTELDKRATAWAWYLRERGARPGVTVGLCLERGVEAIVALLAVLKSGAAYLPLDPEYPPERIEYLVADSDVQIICTHEWIADRLPDGLKIVKVDRVNPLDTPSERGTAGILNDRGGTNDLAYIMYTSGSTGRPKGVEIEHRSVVNRLCWDHRRYGLGPDDVVLHHTSLSFDISVWEVFAALTTGAQLVLAEPGAHQDPADLARLVVDRRITALAVVPSQLDVLLDQEPGLADASSLRYVFSGGEALSPGLCERFFDATDAELHNFYGPTEATVDVTWWHCTRDDLATGVPIGRPLDNVRVLVLDDGEPVPVGSLGELHVGGAGLARGYRGLSALTAERFIDDPFHPGERLYRTGDVVRYRCDGALEFLGRVDDQVKIRGFRVEPGEVEQSLQRHPEVREAVVCVAQDSGTARLEGFAVLDDTEQVDVDTLRGWLSDHLPAHMVPAGLHVVASLPLTTHGKVDRAALLRSVPTSTSTGIIHDARTPLERDLCALLAHMLNVSTLGPEDDFFTFGGDSLQAARAVTAIRRDLDQDVDLGQFVAQPTARGLAEAITARNSRS